MEWSRATDQFTPRIYPPAKTREQSIATDSNPFIFSGDLVSRYGYDLNRSIEGCVRAVLDVFQNGDFV